jgi:hypothetical protein
MTKAANDITRYEIIKDGHEVPCDHPMCWQFHQRFMQRYYDGGLHFDESAGRRVDRYHLAKRTYWLIIDTETDERAFDGDTYDTKSEAKAALARWMRRIDA